MAVRATEVRVWFETAEGDGEVFIQSYSHLAYLGNGGALFYPNPVCPSVDHGKYTHTGFPSLRVVSTKRGYTSSQWHG